VGALSEASVEDLETVDEIGVKIAESVNAFFRDDNSIRLVSRLVSYGLQLELSEEALANQTTLLAGLRIVVSGVFESISRNELKALIEANGGKVVSSISAKTTYLVAGANMGPSKRQKAEQLNIPILTEQEFLEKF
jgi:DNA ligase (NAD+)